MDTGALRLPPLQPASVTYRAPEQTPATTQTDIPAPQAVSPPRESARQPSLSSDRDREESRDRSRTEVESERKLKRESIRDDVTDTLVFRQVDESSGEVIRQIPEESILRLRRALAENQQSTAQPQTIGLDRTL